MSTPLNLDLQARAELLAYLVVSQLLAKAITGEWLSPLHTVESTRLWLLKNGGGADLIDRARLSSCAAGLAKRVAERTPALLKRDIVGGLITENLRIDFRVSITREIYQAYINHLVDMGWT
ncbi:hypothetical protein [Paraburkholderia diazotrophica]|uniref:hypothetical protein n=1 Tax=Paraburkholderia diazotrophica TaxID=667676 RepID=UPI00316DBC1C